MTVDVNVGTNSNCVFLCVSKFRKLVHLLMCVCIREWKGWMCVYNKQSIKWKLHAIVGLLFDDLLTHCFNIQNWLHLMRLVHVLCSMYTPSISLLNNSSCSIITTQHNIFNGNGNAICSHFIQNVAYLCVHELNRNPLIECKTCQFYGLLWQMEVSNISMLISMLIFMLHEYLHFNS